MATEENPNRESLVLDGKEAWLACFCVSLANCACVGSCYIYGNFFPVVSADFKLGKAKSALPGSLACGFNSILCPAATFFVKRFGCRMAILLGGFITALGFLGSSYAPAVGMVSSGLGAGILIMSPLAHIAIDLVGWRKAMLVLAATTLIAGFFGIPISRKTIKNEKDVNEVPKQNDNEISSEEKKPSLFTPLLKFLNALRDPLTALVLTMTTTYYFGHFMPMVHLIKYADDIGVSSHASSWMYPITGIISTFSRVLTGKVGDTGRVSFYTMFQCGLVLMAIAQFLMPLATNVGHLYGYAVVQGICEGLFCTSGFCLAISADPRHGLDWLMFFCAIPLFSAPPIGGYIADSTGSYHPVFYTSGSFLLTAALITFLRHFIRKQSVDLTDNVGWFGKILQTNRHNRMWQSNITVVSVTEPN